MTLPVRYMKKGSDLNVARETWLYHTPAAGGFKVNN
jgi:hypothetical protein